ncbi:hypothetical protein PHYBLDRAFT_74154, partial [Phycomyces blakesleeanus NRRL 1555(-)]
MGIYSLDLIYLQSPAIQVKHQDSDLPAMGIDLIYLQSPAIQVKHQDSDLPAMGIVLVSGHPGQASRFKSRSTDSGRGPRFQYLFHPGQASKPTSKSTVSVSIPSRVSFKVQVKVSGFRSRSTVSGISKLDEQLLTCFCIFLVSIPSRSSFKVQVKVHGFRSSFKAQVKVNGFQIKVHGFSCIHSIQVKLQGPGQGPRFS